MLHRWQEYHLDACTFWFDESQHTILMCFGALTKDICSRSRLVCIGIQYTSLKHVCMLLTPERFFGDDVDQLWEINLNTVHDRHVTSDWWLACSRALEQKTLLLFVTRQPNSSRLKDHDPERNGTSRLFLKNISMSKLVHISSNPQMFSPWHANQEYKHAKTSPSDTHRPAISLQRWCSPHASTRWSPR